MLYLVVEDPDAHHDRARAAGAEIVMPLTDQPYGSREYAALDPEGNVWSFGTYRPKATSAWASTWRWRAPNAPPPPRRRPRMRARAAVARPCGGRAAVLPRRGRVFRAELLELDPVSERDESFWFWW